MRACRFCAISIPEGARFCPSCGAESSLVVGPDLLSTQGLSEGSPAKAVGTDLLHTGDLQASREAQEDRGKQGEGRRGRSAEQGDIRAGDTIAGAYRIERWLGRGGTSRVFLAKDLERDRACALKFFESNFQRDPSFRLRIEQEFRVTNRLEHPAIVRSFALEEDERHGLFLVMEYLEGRTLEEMCQEAEGRGGVPLLAFEDIDRVTEALVEGLEYAHEKGVIHRDLKPSNVMWTTQGQIKLMDFGIAKELSEATLTRAGQLLGTPYFLAPELHKKGNKPSPQTDSYSLGVILFYLVTGRYPIGSFALPSEENPEIPEEFDSFFETALHSNPSGRFVSPKALLAGWKGIRALVQNQASLSFEASAPTAKKVSPLTDVLVGLVILYIPIATALFYFGFHNIWIFIFVFALLFGLGILGYIEERREAKEVAKELEAEERQASERPPKKRRRENGPFQA